MNLKVQQFPTTDCCCASASPTIPNKQGASASASAIASNSASAIASSRATAIASGSASVSAIASAPENLWQ